MLNNSSAYVQLYYVLKKIHQIHLDHCFLLSSFLQQQGEVYRYKVCATGVDGTSFFAEIRIPGTCTLVNSVLVQ